MKKRIALILVCIQVFIFSASAQVETIRFNEGKFLVGIGINIGYFTPDDVNQFVENWMDNRGILETIGFTEIFLNMGGHFVLGYRINDYVELYGTAEYVAGPKIIKIIGGESKSFNFRRISPGFIANGLVPLSKNAKNSLIFGGGMFYHVMKFEDFSGNKVGFRAQFGISLNNFGFNPQIMLAYDFAKGEDEEYEDFGLDYSGIQLCLNLNF
jgi:hypothetical protein